MPAWYEESWNTTYHYFQTAIQYYRATYYNVIDSSVDTIKNGFDQPGQKQLEKLEKLLLFEDVRDHSMDKDNILRY